MVVTPSEKETDPPGEIVVELVAESEIMFGPQPPVELVLVAVVVVPPTEIEIV